MPRNKTIKFNTPHELKELVDFVGIYEIVSPSGKKYIGMTNVNFYNRWTGHLNLLSKNKHHNDGLQKAFNKYGKDNLMFRMVYSYKIEEITREVLCRLEGDYWDECKLLGVRLYNGRPSGGGTEHSLETRAKIRENTINGNPDRFNKTVKLSENINKVLEYANSPITMAAAAAELDCSYGTLNKFVKDNNIIWLNRVKYLNIFYRGVFMDNLEGIIEAATDVNVSKYAGGLLFNIPQKAFSDLLEEFGIEWRGAGVKESSVKFTGAVRDIRAGVTDVTYLAGAHSLTRENIYYLKWRYGLDFYESK